MEIDPMQIVDTVKVERKRSINHTLSVRREIWDAGVHVIKVDTCDGEGFRSI